jgi:hypothetical protein
MSGSAEKAGASSPGHFHQFDRIPAAPSRAAGKHAAFPTTESGSSSGGLHEKWPRLKW